jgi:opacity protein-like surface antigen
MKILPAVGLLAVGGGLALSALPAHAEGPFFTFDAGLNIVDNYDVGNDTQIEFDPGLRLDVGIGYTLHEDQNFGVSVGAESGFIYNEMDKGKSPFGEVGIEGDLWQVPIIGKVVLRFMPENTWVPYIGVGGGVVYSNATVDSIGGTPVDAEGDEWDPAVQAVAGVKYKLNDNSSVGLSYKALFVFPGDGFEEVLNHSILAAFAMHF